MLKWKGTFHDNDILFIVSCLNETRDNNWNKIGASCKIQAIFDKMKIKNEDTIIIEQLSMH